MPDNKGVGKGETEIKTKETDQLLGERNVQIIFARIREQTGRFLENELP